MFPDTVQTRAQKLIEALSQKQLMIATAESCTGGLIVGALTEISGSSAVVHGGFVTYANAAKQNMIGVPAELISEFGAVSEQVSRAMAEGALMVGEVDVAVAVTGVAGPGGGSPEKPVGLVHFSCALKERTIHLKREFGDLGRGAVRLATVVQALDLVLESIADQP